MFVIIFFFFQAEDGIRDADVTGVQTCALPIWLKGTVDLNKYGEIEVDRRGQTSVPGVFAAGDATVSPYKQIIIAMGDGATASLSAFDYLIRNSVKEEGESTA